MKGEGGGRLMIMETFLQLAAKMANQREMEALMRRQAVPPNFGLNGTNGPVVFNNPISIPPHLMAAMQQNHHNGAFSAPGMDAQNFARQSQIQRELFHLFVFFHRIRLCLLKLIGKV